jgi:hypothetical protein
MTRPRAADDFASIRSRMEELRRERMPTPSDTPARSGPSHRTASGRPEPDGARRLPYSLRRKLLG